jgi:hypothetical protein
MHRVPPPLLVCGILERTQRCHTSRRSDVVEAYRYKKLVDILKGLKSRFERAPQREVRRGCRARATAD